MSIWPGELRRRFGTAAPDVLQAYQSASGILQEIVAAHLADPYMYIWPEINPGGLLDAYRDVLPSEWRYIASIRETVHNRIHHIASAKQTAPQTTALLNRLAQSTEDAVTRADREIRADNVEWRSSKPDFQVLAMLARYHALKQNTTDQATYFDSTADRAALDSASIHISPTANVSRVRLYCRPSTSRRSSSPWKLQPDRMRSLYPERTCRPNGISCITSRCSRLMGAAGSAPTPR
jgi:hypothetical protein